MPCRVALVCLAFSAVPLFAQTDPLDLARGLRDIGQPDLSLEYLEDLGKKNPAADVKTILPLEKAKSRLALAQMESEEAARAGGVLQAKSEFKAFVEANPKHPRVVEANLSLAQVTAVEAMSQLNRTRKVAGSDDAAKARRAGIRDEARKAFLEASDLFGKAAKDIAAQINEPSNTAARKRELQKTFLQAELDRGINQYRLVDTYSDDVQGKEAVTRAGELDKARKIFSDLGKKDDTSPVCWQALAWAGMCEYDKQARSDAEKIFKQVKATGSKTEAGADGVRMVEFFEAYIKLEDTLKDKTVPNVRSARALARTWLDKDRYRPRMTPQRLSMTFYYAYLTELLGQSEITFEPQSKEEVAAKKPLKMKPPSQSALVYLKEAAREYKRLIETDNEYTERAEENRNRTIRYVVGDTLREPRLYTEIEECQMAGLLQRYRAFDAREAAKNAADEDDAKAKRKIEIAEFAKAVAFMERARQLITPATPPREAAEIRLKLTETLYYANQFPLAAISGESLARANRGKVSARAGLFAVVSYLQARDLLEQSPKEATADPDAADAVRKLALDSDRDRAMTIAMFLDKTFPNDATTDTVRLRIGQLLRDEKQYMAAFEILGRVSPTYESVASARAVQGRAAYFLLASKESPLSPEQKAAVFQKAVDDCEAMLRLKPSAGPMLKAWLAVGTMLANLHLTNHTFADAERIVSENLERIAASTLEETDKKSLLASAEEVRLRAIAGQAKKLHDDGKFKDMAAKMQPAIEAMKSIDPEASAKLEGEARDAAANLDSYRIEFIGIAMRGRIREGEYDKAAELFEMLNKLGGSNEATSAALRGLVAVVRPQVEQLRKANKGPEADKLSAGIGALLRKQADKDKIPVLVLAELGRSLRALGQYEQAIEVLKKIKPATVENLTAARDKLEPEVRDGVEAHMIAQLELARAYRWSRKFDDADAVLKAALGDDKTKGWTKSLIFKREAVLLLEEKAAATGAEPKGARGKAWVDAKNGWDKLIGQYAAAIRSMSVPPKLELNEKTEPALAALIPAAVLVIESNESHQRRQNDRLKLIPTYLELVCDLRRCLARANTQLLADNPAKLKESLEKLAQSVFETETAHPKSLTGEVRAKFLDLLNDYLPIKEAYKKLGGKAFLEGADGSN